MKRKNFPLILLLTALVSVALVTAASAAGLPTAEAGGEGNSRHLVLMILYASVALIFSFMCSVAEAVLLSISPSFIARLRQQGKPLAARLQRLKAGIDRSLAAILTLNTIAHTVGAGGAGAEAAAYFGERWVGVSMAVLTLLILFLSEIVPKTLGAVYWRPLAGLTASFVRLLILTLYPLIWVSEQLTKLITKGRPAHPFSREEFAALADVGVERGQIEAGESRILKNLFRFPKLQARDIMTPRTVVFSLQQDLSVERVLDEYPELPFSRLPIFGENRDDVRGFVLKTDLLLAQLRGEGSQPLRELGRELEAVAEDSSLEIVFNRLLQDQLQLLLVLDEYGGMVGVVALEDVVETLIGIEIVDELDEVDDLRRHARQQWEKRRQRHEAESGGEG